MPDLRQHPRARLAALGLTAGLAAFAAGCGTSISLAPGGPSSSESSSRKLTITPALNGKAVSLAIGQQLDVRLPTSPVDGFDWVRDGADTGVLVALGPPAFERQRLDINDFDNAGFDVWHFKSAVAGQQNLRFEYRRRGQLSTEPPEAVWFLITVR